MVEDTYPNIRSKVKINDLLPDPFTLTWEVFQGCLFSTLLHISETEVCASFINSNKRIKGTLAGRDHEIKIVDFTDDNTILLRLPALIGCKWF